jgi:N-acetylmuramoyl-L-alanine amidase
LRKVLLSFGFVALLLAIAFSAEEKRLAIYTPQSTFFAPVVDRQGREYITLADVLGRLGTTVNSGSDAAWKVRFKKIESQFAAGQAKASIGGKDITLPAPALLENDSLLVPLSALPTLLPRYLGKDGKFELRESARRLFVGVSPSRISAEIKKQEPPTLVLTFNSPVNPSINSEPGKVRLVFAREPVVSEESQRFDDKTITAASFHETNGGAELTVSSSAPLIATFSNGNKTLTLVAAPEAAKQEPAATPSVPAASAAPGSTATPAETPSVITPATVAGGSVTPTPSPRFLVVIDASHGGAEPGATLKDGLEEKDVTLAIAKRVRAELQTRGVNVMLLRDSDATIPLEQRAEMVNTMRGAVYVAIHAGAMGYNTNIFTALMSKNDADNPRAAFVPWESVQQEHLDRSRIVAESVSAELRERQVPVLMAPAPLRPLNNIAAAAIGVEVCSADGDPAGLTNSAYQQRVALALAIGIAKLRDDPEVRR